MGGLHLFERCRRLQRTRSPIHLCRKAWLLGAAWLVFTTLRVIAFSSRTNSLLHTPAGQPTNPLWNHPSGENENLETLLTERDEDGSIKVIYNEGKVRYRCRVAYDGTGFSGFQLQPNGKRTVQNELEKVLSKRLDRPLRVVGASRTDAGVHARGQAIQFDLTLEEHEKLSLRSGDAAASRLQLEQAMNSMLPTDIRVWKVQQAPEPCEESINGSVAVLAWNVMRKCDAKLYCYRICVASGMDPVERFHRWHIDQGHEVNLQHLQSLLKSFQGSHDFICFAGALEQTQRKTGRALNTTRTIHEIKLIEEDRERQFYRIDILLDGEYQSIEGWFYLWGINGNGCWRYHN